MCENCDAERLGRRGFLKTAGLAAAGLAAGLTPALAAAPAEAPNMPPEAALKRMMDGNSRYIADPATCVADMAKQRKATATGQKPFGMVLGCADSRVAPELVFGGTGPGELFVARNAGNTADDITIGSLEYGALILGASALMVLGHGSCGAVAAAVDLIDKNTVYPATIEAVVRPILPAALIARGQGGDVMEKAIAENARRTVKRIVERSRILDALVQGGRLKIVAGVYDLDSGKVSLL